MTSALMKMSAVAETGFVERKRAPATPAVASDPIAPQVRLAFATLVVLLAVSAGAAFLVLGLYGFR